ncbi:1,4-alpha-glucan branching enzyme [Arcanobacterium pluranimalium]|uniref:phosphotransferase n=1 Tax=Arcanobacterium pluranimalium TaxID=108028 RepID=UPI0019574DD4|nr:phosphotransferase [Arcanobacterium pluranimalium]MBM7825821.1 1,4-alpha-glucan branching enzyme [Arcanobacterium pluranimalium]
MLHSIANFELSASESFQSQLNTWLVGTRWYANKTDRSPAQIQAEFLLAAEDRAAVKLLIVDSLTNRYFVPVVLRARRRDERQGEAASSVIGVVGNNVSTDELVEIIDATDDRFGQLTLLRCCFGAESTDARTGEIIRSSVLHARLDQLPQISSIEKMRAEQSNTSLVYHFAQADSFGTAGLIMKLLRIVQIGNNPDVELQTALDTREPRTVARQYASARVALGKVALGKTATERVVPDEVALGEARPEGIAPEGMANSVTAFVRSADAGYADMLVAQEFLSGSVDAWQVFVQEVEQVTQKPQNPQDLRTLGQLTADFHAQLRELFPLEIASENTKASIVRRWEERAQRAIECAPELGARINDMRAIFAAATDAQWPDLQRIHGDYHLGQVLRVPNQGWKAVDFEGEPIRPLPERVQPDLALRDVAGMLRSFDYVAGAAELNGKPASFTRAWAQEAKSLFLAGYGAISPEEEGLLAALTLEKSLYEVAYEASYRPRWLQIPIAAVHEILNSYISSSVNSPR